MTTELPLRERYLIAEDASVEFRIWRVPNAVSGSAHDYKYGLAYVVAGQCDNEAGKGDNRHIGAAETPYRFTTPDALLADFWDDVETWRPE